MKASPTPVVKDLVLVGGGHAHVAVLRRFGMDPVPGLRLTLVTRDVHTPYSGMLPGYVAGHYGYDDCHIDLGPLARFAGARLYHAEVEGLDLKGRQVRVSGRPPVTFDLLSINTGSRPRTLDVPGAAEHALPVKPIDRFLAHWEALMGRVLASKGPFRIVVVGGGAGGVELALATQYRLRQRLAEAGDDPGRLRYALLTRGPEILPTHNPGVRRRFRRVLAERGIALLHGPRGGRGDGDRGAGQGRRARRRGRGPLGDRCRRTELAGSGRTRGGRGRLHRGGRAAPVDLPPRHLRRRGRGGPAQRPPQVRGLRGPPGAGARRQPAPCRHRSAAATLPPPAPLPRSHQHR